MIIPEGYAWEIHKLKDNIRYLEDELFAKNQIIDKYRDLSGCLPFKLDYAPVRYKREGTSRFVVVMVPVLASDVDFYYKRIREALYE